MNVDCESSWCQGSAFELWCPDCPLSSSFCCHEHKCPSFTKVSVSGRKSYSLCVSMCPGNDDMPQLHCSMHGQTWCAYQLSLQMCILWLCLVQNNIWTYTSLSHHIAYWAISCSSEVWVSWREPCIAGMATALSRCFTFQKGRSSKTKFLSTFFCCFWVQNTPLKLCHVFQKHYICMCEWIRGGWLMTPSTVTILKLLCMPSYSLVPWM
jgi:hypothetical protein